jgi:hypothetical protein
LKGEDKKRFDFMVFNATCNNISYISCQSLLLMGETGGPRKTTDLCYFEISANINGTISHVKFSKRILPSLIQIGPVVCDKWIEMLKADHGPSLIMIVW